MPAATTVTCVGALLAILVGPADARGRSGSDATGVGGRVPEAVTAERRDPSAAWTAGTVDCSRGRRKLWRAGEGWIVKTMTICR